MSLQMYDPPKPDQPDLLEEEDEEAGLSFVLPHWTTKRHLTGGNPKSLSSSSSSPSLDWRLKSRLKTHAAALVICLNIATDPPDIVKTKPCAKLECWVDPSTMRPEKALEEVGKNLQRQFETLSQKVRYKLYLDPAFEDTKKLCHQLRKTAKDERVLFYYNGHGVPAPTASGEIWVFNRTYTQYIPVSLYDLQDWLGSPCIFVWDCSNAGNIVNNFNRWAERRDTEAGKHTSSSQNADGSPSAPMRECIQLAACAANEILPMTPDLPADLFTSCLTSPIEIALRYYALQDPLKPRGPNAPPRPRVSVDMVMKIPGDLKDRRTPLGELNWIFTSVTDTIAWLIFPKDLFRRLFRQDLLVAALFRNFLLAERIMRTYNCTPRSEPALPPTHNHPLWDSWDLTVEACLAQLPDLLRAEASTRDPTLPPFQYHYKPSNFYVEHLTALQVWLHNSGVVPRPMATANNDDLAGPMSVVHDQRRPPEQLPIVLQVLLSQAHRLRALILLSKFVDLGPWAVHQALEIGIFPYVQRLLQSPAVELRPVLIFIWSRILAVDRSCQADLLKDNGFAYFSTILSPFNQSAAPLLIPNASEHRAMCAFILAVFCRDFRPGQQALLTTDVCAACLVRLKDDDYLLRQWAPLCIAQLWDGNDDAKSLGLQCNAPNVLCEMLRDNSVEVRAAVLYALGTFFGCSGSSNPDAKGGGGSGVQLNRTERDQLRTEIGVATSAVLATYGDASPMVRKELVVMLSAIVREWRGWFVAAAWCYWEEHLRSVDGREYGGSDDLVSNALQEWATIPRDEEIEGEMEEDKMILSSCNTVFTALLELSVDPYAEVSTLACTVVDYVSALLIDSAFMTADGTKVRPDMFKNVDLAHPKPPGSSSYASTPAAAPLSATETSFPFPTLDHSSPARAQHTPPPKPRHHGLIRQNSVAARLMNVAGYLTPAPESPPEEVDVVETHPPINGFDIAHYRPPYPRSVTEPPLTPTTPSATSIHSSGYFRPTPDPESEPDEDWSRGAYPSCTAAEVIAALVEEDMERLIIRRHAGAEAGGMAAGGGVFGGRSSELGIGLVARRVKDDVLPLKSNFFDWSCEYYTESQMKSQEPDEPGSEKYNEQLWRRERNERIDLEARTASERISSDIVRSQKEHKQTKHPWNKPVSKLVSDSWPMKMAFHSFEDHLAVSDEHDSVCVWDWRSKKRLSRFSNGSGSGPITSMYFINEVSEALLLTASAEGNVRLFRKYDDAGEMEIASAFRAVSTTATSSTPSGTITAWDQHSGNLYVAGDMDYIRVWDANRELTQADVPTKADCPITSLSTETDGAIFAAGLGDGTVQLFDKRCPPEESLVRTYDAHDSWVSDVRLQEGGNTLVSGSFDGVVNVWDFRLNSEPVSTASIQPNGLSAISTHSHSPFVASMSAPSVDNITHRRSQYLDVHYIGTPQPTLITHRLIPINATSPTKTRPFAPWKNALTFHPKEMLIAVGGISPTITIIGPDFDKWAV